jgi:1-Cys peroxiredoxin 6
MQPGYRVSYPVIADPSRELIEQYNMVDPDEKDSPGQSVPSRALRVAGADRGASSKTRSNFSIFLLTDLVSHRKRTFLLLKFKIIVIVYQLM